MKPSARLCISLSILAGSSALVVGRLASQSPAEGEIARLKAHYAAAEEELLARDVSRLSPEQRAERDRLMRVFREYRERGVFTENRDFPGERMPYFVDRQGTRCAVANLLHATGQDGLVARVAAARNHAWVAEIAGDAEFLSWLDRSGLSVEEAARIQGPGSGGPPFLPREIFRVGGSADRPPSSGSEDAGTAAGLGIGAGPTGGFPSTSPGPFTSNGLGSSEEDWSSWWEMNKGEYLRPNRPRLATAPPTGDDPGDSSARDLVDEEGRKLVPLLVGLLQDRDDAVRSASALALGRIARREAIPYLRVELKDPNPLVRNSAILALGATRSGEAVPDLLHLAAEDPSSPRKGSQASTLARSLAVVALGIGRRGRPDDSTDSAIAAVLRDVSKEDGTPLRTAALLYQTLAPSALLQTFAAGLASDGEQPTPVRCRAVETLRFASDSETLAGLLRALSGRSLEVRRSAALALGEFEHPLALQPLQTAFELEEEPLARAFILLSIGKQGGPGAERFLLRVLRSGPNRMRPWCALALGILAREAGDPTARRAIREACEIEKNGEARGAYFIASGIARDTEAADGIREALATSRNAHLRMTAALALAMTGHPGAREALLARLGQERCEWTRVAIAQALGYVGDARDAGVLLQTLKELRQLPLERDMAVALGIHGTKESLRGLVEIVRDPGIGPAARTAAIGALGLLLGEEPTPTIEEIAQRANYTVFPDWVRALLRITV